MSEFVTGSVVHFKQVASKQTKSQFLHESILYIYKKKKRQTLSAAI